MQQFSPPEAALLAAVDASPMLGQVQAWSAVNTGTGNLAGLAEQAGLLADAFAALPGDVSLEQPAPVSAISAGGAQVPVEYGKHLVENVFKDDADGLNEVAWTIVDPDASWTVEADKLASLSTNTPYESMTLPAVVTATVLRGVTTNLDGKIVS